MDSRFGQRFELTHQGEALYGRRYPNGTVRLWAPRGSKLFRKVRWPTPALAEEDLDLALTGYLRPLEEAPVEPAFELADVPDAELLGEVRRRNLLLVPVAGEAQRVL